MLLVNSLTISNKQNGRNTCSFRLRDRLEGFAPLIGQEVIVEDNGTKIFAGTIDRTRKSIPIRASEKFFDIECTDFNQLADRHLVPRIFTSQLAGDIVRDIVNTELVDEGITNGGVEDSFIIEKAVFAYVTAAEAFNDLSRITGLSWNIDEDKVMNFFDRATNIAPFKIKEGFGNHRNVVVTRQREQYRNTQFLRAGNDITDLRTESFVGDGTRAAFVLKFKVALVPAIKLNSVTKTVGIRGVEGGKDFYWSKFEKEITPDDGATPLVLSDDLDVTYQGFFPIIVKSVNSTEVTDRATIEGGTGIYEDIVDDPSIENNELALQKVNGLLRRFGTIPEIVSFQTDQNGLKSGQLLTVELPEFGLNGTFLIDSVDINDIDGLILRHDVIALSGEHLGGWHEFFRKLAEIGREFVIRENELLLLLRQFDETITITDAFNTVDPLEDFKDDPYSCWLVGSAVVGKSRHCTPLEI